MWIRYVNLVEISGIHRYYHTRHDMHLKWDGKQFLSAEISKSINSKYPLKVDTIPLYYKYHRNTTNWLDAGSSFCNPPQKKIQNDMHTLKIIHQNVQHIRNKTNQIVLFQEIIPYVGHSIPNKTKLNEVSTTPSSIFMIFILQVDSHEVKFSQSFNFFIVTTSLDIN